MVATHRRTLALAVALSLGHVLLISAQVQTRSGLPVIAAVAFGAFSRVHLFSAGVAGGVRSVWTRYLALRDVASENDELRQRVVELEARLQTLEAETRTTRALEDALGLQASLDVPTLAARVIAGSPVPGEFMVTIDRGTADGIRPDLAVLAVEGLVGRVVGQPSPHTARVQLLIDLNAGLGATLERSGAGGLLVGGAGDPPLRLDFVSNLADVEPGELVFTSGQDRLYPPGFVIGTVEEVRAGPLFREITVRPAVDFSHIDIVLVVLSVPRGAEAAGS